MRANQTIEVVSQLQVIDTARRRQARTIAAVQRLGNQERIYQRINSNYRIGFNHEINENENPEFTVGMLDQECIECGSLNFTGERTSNDVNRFTQCCQKGKVKLQPLTPFSPLIVID